jgi:bifunctional ADP-heptose synthase (sugar kinase/adenylyltransferase)
VILETQVSLSVLQSHQQLPRHIPRRDKTFLQDFSKHYSFEKIVSKLDTLKGMKVLLIGDGIIDEYHYCTALGRSSKTPIVVNKYLTHEDFAGAVFIIANHIAGICEKVHLVTLLGRKDSREEFVRASLRPNVEPHFFYREDGPTIVKRRYIDQYRNQKLFEINYLNENYINGNCESSIIDYLKEVVKDYDLVLVSISGTDS